MVIFGVYATLVLVLGLEFGFRVSVRFRVWAD